jgi:cell shape-determining protein MreC
VELAHLRSQLDHYRVLVGEREKLGSLAERCALFTVIGADSGNRRSINIVGRSAGSLRVGMVALTPTAVVGRVERAGVGGASVLLLTDRQSVLTCEFRRPAAPDGQGGPMEELIPLPPTLVHGTGGSTLRSDKLSLKDVQSAGLRVGDRVAINDTAWPVELLGYTIGRVAKIGPSAGSVLFADIEIEPIVDATHLKDVMVMMK